MPTAQMDNNALVRSFSDRYALNISIDHKLRRFHPKEVVVIACIDYRENGREGFLLTSAGNIPHPQLLQDLHLVLPDKRLLVLRCHSDCAKSKAELPRLKGEHHEAYEERLEGHTLKRLWRDAAQLLQDPAVQRELGRGLKFLCARYDVHTRKTTYFAEESRQLVEEVCKNNHRQAGSSCNFETAAA